MEFSKKPFDNKFLNSSSRFYVKKTAEYLFVILKCKSSFFLDE